MLYYSLKTGSTLKGIVSTELFQRFNEIFEEINDPRMFCRFNSFLSESGFIYRYKSPPEQRFAIRIMNSDNKTTKFGKIFEKYNQSVEAYSNVILLDKEDSINTINCINDLYDYFSKKEKSILESKKKYGGSINNDLRSLGASDNEIRVYWRNVKEKKLLPPLKYMAYLITMDRSSLTTENVINCLKRCNREEFKKNGLDYLPKNLEVANWILKSFKQTRYFRFKKGNLSTSLDRFDLKATG